MTKKEEKQLYEESKQKRKEGYAEVLRKLGLEPGEDPESEIMDIITNNEPLESKEIGYETEEGAYEAWNHEDGEPAKLYLCRINDRYAVYLEHEYDGGWLSKLTQPDEIEVFDTLEEAQAFMNGWEYGVQPVDEVIQDIYKDLKNSDTIGIMAKYPVRGKLAYAVLYKDILIIDECRDLNADRIKEQLKKADNYIHALEERGIDFDDYYFQYADNHLLCKERNYPDDTVVCSYVIPKFYRNLTKYTMDLVERAGLTDEVVSDRL